MALVNTTLKNDLISVYKSMTDGDNKIFSQKVSAACIAINGMRKKQ